ncbi:hypothetical protein [Citricoccus sp. GCM10030269]|uniref:hypothetical protein n=1 Tax=Citricoccus sp. GCM10030269 TaxID=3273388 RepID=UPI0036230CBE
MAWAKRGGGSGTGVYGQGLAVAGTAAPGPESPVVPNSGPRFGDEFQSSVRHGGGVVAPPEDDGARPPAPAYRPTRWEDVRDNRIILDVLAHWAKEGNEPEMSMLYEDALAQFGEGSVHLSAACRGQFGAGPQYQQTVARGRFRSVD